MRRCVAVLAALVLPLISACFYSQEELIGFWGADRALAPGLYTHTPYDPQGQEWDRPTWRGEIAYEGRRYVSEVADFPHQNARLKRLDGDIYIAQWPRRDGIGYGILFLYGDMATYHQPDCSALPSAVREETGITLGEEGFCEIADLDQLEAVIRSYLVQREGDLRIDGIYRRVR